MAKVVVNCSLCRGVGKKRLHTPDGPNWVRCPQCKGVGDMSVEEAKVEGVPHGIRSQ